VNPAESASLARALDPKSLERREVEPIVKPVVAEPWSKADGYAAVDARSGGRCECHGLWRTGCGQPATVHHHIAGRGGPDPHHPDNLLHLADECHRLIHASPEASYAAGTMRRRNGAGA